MVTIKKRRKLPVFRLFLKIALQKRENMILNFSVKSYQQRQCYHKIYTNIYKKTTI